MIANFKDILPDLWERELILDLLWKEVVKNTIESKMKYLSGEKSSSCHNLGVDYAGQVFQVYKKLGGNTKLGSEEFDFKKYKV